jgi:hypothetical protein
MVGTFFLAQAASNAAIQTTYADSAEVMAFNVYFLAAARRFLNRQLVDIACIVTSALIRCEGSLF